MFQIDDAFLESLGLGTLPQQEKENMKRQIYEALEMRVGMTLASNMTEAQLDEFEGLMNKNDEEGALKWLESNFPNYRQVVAEELEKLKAEVKSSAPQILAEVQAAQQPGGQPAPSGPAGAAGDPQGGYGQQPMQQQPYPQQPGVAGGNNQHQMPPQQTMGGQQMSPYPGQQGQPGHPAQPGQFDQMSQPGQPPQQG